MNPHEEGSLLSAYLDGELPPSGAAGVEAHLEACAACRGELESLRRVKSILRAAPRRTLPPELLASLESRRPRPSWARWLRGLPRLTLWAPLGAAASVAVLLGFWAFWRFSEQDALPLEPLLAAHSRYATEGLVPQEALDQPEFSAQLAVYNGD